MNQGLINKINIDGTVGAISLQTTANNPFIPNINIKPITFMQTAIRQPVGLWDTDVKISAPNVSLQWAGGHTFALNDFDFVSKTNVDSNNLYNGSANMSVKEMLIPSGIISSISALDITFLMNHLNPEGLAEYKTFISEHKSSSFTEEDSKIMMTLLSKAMTSTSSFNLNAAFNSPLGNFSMKSVATKQPNAPEPKAIPDLLESFVVQANLRIAAPLLSKIIETYIVNTAAERNKAENVIVTNDPASAANNMINTWMQEGYLIQDGGDYIANITTTGGVLKVNGKVLDQPVPAALPPVTTPSPGFKPLAPVQ